MWLPDWVQSELFAGATWRADTPKAIAQIILDIDDKLDHRVTDLEWLQGKIAELVWIVRSEYGD